MTGPKNLFVIGAVLGLGVACGPGSRAFGGDDTIDPVDAPSVEPDASVADAALDAGVAGGTILDAFVIGGSSWDNVFATAISPAGDLALGGAFAGQSDLGSGPVTATSSTTFATAEGFLAVRRADGSSRFVRIFGGCDTDSVQAVSIDEAGAIYVAVSARQISPSCPFRMDGTTLISSTQSEWSTVLFKLDADGALVWHRTIPATIERVVARSGRLVVSTHAIGSVALGGGITVFGSSGVVTLGLAALRTTDGTAIWGRALGAKGDGNLYALELRPSIGDQGSSSIAAAVTLGATWTLGGAVGTITPEGPTDGLILEVALATGAVTAASRVGAGGTDSAHAVRDVGGTLIGAGSYQGAVTVDGTNLPPGASGTDGFVLRRTANSTAVWSLGLDRPAVVWDVASAGSDPIVVAHTTGAETTSIITRRGPDGSERWTRRFTEAETTSRLVLLNAEISGDRLYLIGGVGPAPAGGGTFTLPGGIVRSVAGDWDIAVVVLAL